MHLRWTAIAFAAWTACAAESASRVPTAGPQRPAPDEPIVGRLKMKGRIVDLTASSFAPGRSDLPREAMATQVMADVDRDTMSPATARDGTLDRAR